MTEPYSFETVLDMCSVDFTGRWQPGAIFRAMQDASNMHCVELHLTYEDLIGQGICWVLTRAALHMDRYPTLGKRVTVKTWPTKTRHTFFPRHYTFEEDGEQIGCATTLYVLLDVETRKIAMPSRLAVPVPDYEIPAPLPMPGNILKLEQEQSSTRYTPVYTDYDMNHHVNNTRYIDWFMNQFPYAHHVEQELADLLIHYNYEVKPDEALTLSMHQQGNVNVLQGMDGEQLNFAVQGTWRRTE